MKPDCLCKNIESGKISADKMCPSLYPILLRGEDWRRISSFFNVNIFYLRNSIFLSADKMYPSLYLER